MVCIYLSVYGLYNSVYLYGLCGLPAKFTDKCEKRFANVWQVVDTDHRGKHSHKM